MKRRSRIVMIVALLTILALGMETAMASAASLSQIQKNIKSKQQELNKSKAQEKSLADQVIKMCIRDSRSGDHQGQRRFLYGKQRRMARQGTG